MSIRMLVRRQPRLAHAVLVGWHIVRIGRYRSIFSRDHTLDTARNVTLRRVLLTSFLAHYQPLSWCEGCLIVSVRLTAIGRF